MGTGVVIMAGNQDNYGTSISHNVREHALWSMGLDLGSEAGALVSCPQCEIGPLRCDDAMRAMYRELGTPDKNANSRKGRGLEWDQKFRIWERVRASNPECVRFSIDTEARINRVWIQLAHGYRAVAQGNANV